MARNGSQVVITRKDKRLHKGAHLAAFVLTGGTSGIVTAAKGVTNAAYNARTRQLQEQADEGTQVQVTRTATMTQRLDARGDAARQARAELGLTGVKWRKLTREQKQAVHARADELMAG